MKSNRNFICNTEIEYLVTLPLLFNGLSPPRYLITLHFVGYLIAHKLNLKEKKQKMIRENKLIAGESESDKKRKKKKKKNIAEAKI